MKFSKYILCYACLCVVGVTSAFSEFSESDPEIAKLKEKVDAQQSEIDAEKAESKKLNTLIEEAKSQIQKTQTDLNEGLTAVGNEIKANTQKLEQLSGLQEKVEKLEKQAAQGGSSEQISSITNDLKDLKSEIQNLATQNNSGELDLIKASLNNINTQLAEKKATDEQQNIDAAKYSARLEKLEKQSNSSAKDPAMTNLMGTALQGGMGLLSNVFDLQKMKNKLASGQSAATTSKNLTPEEKAELSSIEKDIASGKSDQEIQQKLDALNSKTAAREIAENKFPKIIFTGVDSGLKDKTIIRHIISQAESGKKVNMNEILSTPVNDINQEVADAIYDMIQKNATISDLRNSIKLIFSGNPGKTVKPKTAQNQQAAIKQNLAENGTPSASSSIINNQYSNAGNNSTQQAANITTGATNALGNQLQSAQQFAGELIDTGMGALGNVTNHMFGNKNQQETQSNQFVQQNTTAQQKTNGMNQQQTQGQVINNPQSNQFVQQNTTAQQKANGMNQQQTQGQVINNPQKNNQFVQPNTIGQQKANGMNQQQTQGQVINNPQENNQFVQSNTTAQQKANGMNQQQTQGQVINNPQENNQFVQSNTIGQQKANSMNQQQPQGQVINNPQENNQFVQSNIAGQQKANSMNQQQPQGQIINNPQENNQFVQQNTTGQQKANGMNQQQTQGQIINNPQENNQFVQQNAIGQQSRTSRYIEELMTVMDIANGKHYDVEKNAFLSIAVPTYIKETNAAKKTVTPIDSKAAKLLTLLK